MPEVEVYTTPVCPYCERLGTPFPHDMGPGMLSIRAIADPPAYGRARAAVRYDEIARALCMRSNTAAGWSLHPPWAGGWRKRAANCSSAPRACDIATSRTFQD